MKKNKRKGEVEIINAIQDSATIRECLQKLYEGKNVPGQTYIRISEIMITSGARFNNGGVYVHPSLGDLYKEHKDKKPLKIKVYD